MTWLMCLGCLLFFLLQVQVNCSLSFSSNSSSTKLCPHDQSFALLQLKNSFSSFNSSSDSPCDESYPKMNRWEENADCCSWDGVTCDKVTGHVIGLDLSCSWLRGTIHFNSSLFLLPHLQRLNVAFNNLDRSQISSEFGRFTNLTHLNLSSSAFSGHIPSEISHLSKLVSLDLSYDSDQNFALSNFLRLNASNLKNLVQNLTKLTQLSLGGVNMSSVEVGSLTNLYSSLIGLRLKDCGLRGEFPSNIFQLPNLQTLDLSKNYNLTIYFPKAIWRSGLKFLDLSNINFLQEVPHSINNLQSLNYLDLSFCNFSGSIPAFLGNLTQVTYLDLSWNNFSGSIPIWLGNLTQISSLRLSFNKFNGQIPSSLSKLEKLTVLDLFDNHLNGSIPIWLGNLTQISSLWLSFNKFSGQIPSSLSKLEKLTVLDLFDNHLNGSIPTWLGNLTQISSLLLGRNDFGGQIPLSLSKLKNLKSLSLSKNHFNGPIPTWLDNLTQMNLLLLNENNFSGQIPSTLSKLDQLIGLRLDNNHFTRSISAQSDNLTQLHDLYLGSNNFSGQIPAQFGSLSQLYLLDLSSNNFSGQISPWLGNLPQLLLLDLSSNNFSGQIPPSLLKLELLCLNLSTNLFSGYFPSPGVEHLPLKYLRYLDLHSNMLQGPLPIPPLTTTFFRISNNRFTGEIPSLICNVSSLEILDLSNNSLSGIIPQCLGNFAKNLSVLDLRMNCFHGTIPKTFVKGNALRSLHFNGNKLEGLLPQSLVNCTKLEVLDLGNNKINDTFPYWLETLPELQVLILRSNGFHGPINDSKTKHSFPKLRIFDLSGNDFNGPLPTRYIENLIAMMNAYEDKTEPKYIEQDYYQDSVTVAIKGVVLQMDRILTIFTTIDLCNNNFQGEILKSIGNLSSLRLLNFSHNNLTGHIPSLLEHLRNLESLDLSSNNLVGEIPRELTSLNFLSMLNLSQNHLEGPIPQGPQFNTFENNSYLGNLGLCGHPLSKKCNNEETPQPPPFIFPKEDDPGFAGGFEWKAVAMGYGSGTILGLVMGYLIFLTGKPEWLVRIVEGKRYKVRRLKKNANTRGGRSN